MRFGGSGPGGSTLRGHVHILVLGGVFQDFLSFYEILVYSFTFLD